MKTLISTIFNLLFLILILNNNIFSQTDNEKSVDKSSISSNYVFDVYIIGGYGLGYKIFTKSDSEIRLLLNISTNYDINDIENKRKSISNGTETSKSESSESSNGRHQIYFTTQYLLTFYKSNFGESYFGFGPFLGYNSMRYSNNYHQEESENENLNIENRISIGLTSLIGIRSKLSNSLSIFAEAQLIGGQSWVDSESENSHVFNSDTSTNKSINEGNAWYYSFSYARIGLRFSI
jgi:hypothetical protein